MIKEGERGWFLPDVARHGLRVLPLLVYNDAWTYLVYTCLTNMFFPSFCPPGSWFGIRTHNDFDERGSVKNSFVCVCCRVVVVVVVLLLLLPCCCCCCCCCCCYFCCYCCCCCCCCCCFSSPSSFCCIRFRRCLSESVVQRFLIIYYRFVEILLSLFIICL